MNLDSGRLVKLGDLSSISNDSPVGWIEKRHKERYRYIVVVAVSVVIGRRRCTVGLLITWMDTGDDN